MSAPPQNPWAEPLTKPIDELRTYLCNVPDFVEGSKRLEIRPTHLEQSKAGREIGWILQAGATFSDDTRTKMTGSWYLLREESVEKARERLNRDVYAKGGAWDMSRVTITAVAVSGSKP